jgi:twitching motility protein PilT
VDRIVDVFPPDQQPHARAMLADSLQGVLAQMLLRTADGRGRVAAFEVLLRSPALPSLIRDGNTPQIASLLQAGRKDGMQPMDDALAALVRRGAVTSAEAWRKAMDKRRFDDPTGRA